MKNRYTARLTAIEKYLQTILPEKSDNVWLDKIYAPARDLLERGGKRWRPILMMLFYELYRQDDRILPLTPLVELPHNGTLIIDDIEDSSDFRRGKKAVHLIYGTDVSINTGNFLYFLPHKLIDSCDFSDDVKLAAYRFYNESMTLLHTGQGYDILWHRNKDYIPTVDEYMTMCSYKTGALSMLSGRLGVKAGGGSDSKALEMGLACQAMGVGFQILDDIINLVTGNPGKKRGDDIVEGKKSLPVILCSNSGGYMVRLKEIFRYASENGIEKAGDAVEEAISIIASSGAIDRAREKAVSILEESKEKILSNYKSSEALELIGYIFDSFLKPCKGEK